MTAYCAFIRKEFMEGFQTHKTLVLTGIFLLFGMINPLTAKLMPVLIDSFMPPGIQITITEPTALDSWQQFFKNVPQIGLFVLVIVFSGLMSGELSRGTLIPMLTKGLPRRTVILSKLTGAVTIWTACYLLCFAVSYSYTILIFQRLSIPHLIFSAACVWLFGILLLSVTLLGGILFSNNYGCLLFTGSSVLLLFLLNMIPALRPLNPLILISQNMSLLMEKTLVSDFMVPVIITVLITALSTMCSILTFGRKKI